MEQPAALVIVKTIHTVAWALLAGCVLAVPICALRGRVRLAVILSVVVLCETGVLALNHLHCPLTDLAARFTSERQDNFDIYLPLWLARYNKQIFGPLFLAGELILAWVWWHGKPRASRESSAAQTPSAPSRPPLSRLAKAAVSLEIFLSAGALGGGAALMLGPKGEIIPLPLSALGGSPFASYFVPGLILFCALGIGPLAAAALAWRRHPLAPLAASAAGAALLIWLAVEIAIVGYSNDPPLQAVYLVLGAAIAAVGVGWHRRPHEVIRP